MAAQAGQLASIHAAHAGWPLPNRMLNSLACQSTSQAQRRRPPSRRVPQRRLDTDWLGRAMTPSLPLLISPCLPTPHKPPRSRPCLRRSLGTPASSWPSSTREAAGSGRQLARQLMDHASACKEAGEGRVGSRPCQACCSLHIAHHCCVCSPAANLTDRRLLSLIPAATGLSFKPPSFDSAQCAPTAACRRGGRVQLMAIPMPDSDYYSREKGGSEPFKCLLHTPRLNRLLDCRSGEGRLWSTSRLPQLAVGAPAVPSAEHAGLQSPLLQYCSATSSPIPPANAAPMRSLARTVLCLPACTGSLTPTHVAATPLPLQAMPCTPSSWRWRCRSSTWTSSRRCTAWQTRATTSRRVPGSWAPVPAGLPVAARPGGEPTSQRRPAGMHWAAREARVTNQTATGLAALESTLCEGVCEEYVKTPSHACPPGRPRTSLRMRCRRRPA